jgi:hypothetical protein
VVPASHEYWHGHESRLFYSVYGYGVLWTHERMHQWMK